MAIPEKSKIIICYHRETVVVKNDEVFIPLHVGKARCEEEILEGIQGDNEGDNISLKNNLYCELTGLYWLWKNVDADNYGLFHYRRFLDIGDKYPEPVTLQNLNVSDWNAEAVSEVMQNYDLVLPKPTGLFPSVYEQYKASHIIEDLNVVKYIIQNDFPEYAESAERVLCGSQMCIGNLFVMKKAMLDEYCNMLFGILGKAETMIYLGGRVPYQTRSLAFMAERIFNIFIDKQIASNPDLKIKYVRLLSF